jgi:lactate dehydrogenase-like 2-hydroxyacid dehydrogenase
MRSAAIASAASAAWFHAFVMRADRPGYRATVNRHRLLVVSPIPPELRARLSARHRLVDRRPGGGETLPGFEVAVTTSMGGADAALIDALPDLKLIACNGTGLEAIDLDDAARRGIAVCHTPDVVTEDTADFAIGLMYAVSRRIAEADRFVRSGRWTAGRMTPSRRLYDKRLGIVGLGRIGAAIARRAAAIGMDVSYTGPREKPRVSYRYLPDAGALADLVDVLVLSCPGGDVTRHLIDTAVLARLGADGLLINVSRGSVVDETALIAALKSGAIAAAGLDVFAHEPDIDPAFLDLENVVLQPHYAAVTNETRNAMADVLEAAIEAHFAAARAG